MKQKKKVVIVAGGTLRKQFVPHIRRGDVIIGVDRGSLWLLQQGIVPHMAIGDFDSVTASELRIIKKQVTKVVVHPRKKDATDLELAIDETVRLRPSEVTVYGALGTRFDHTMGSIHMLQKLLSHNIYGEIVDNFNKINIVRREHRFSKSSKYRYVSVFPIEHEAIVTLTGFQYSIRRFRLQSGSTLGVSNELKAKIAMIKVHKGAVFMIQSRD